MTRLHVELHRLYLSRSAAQGEGDPQSSALIDASGRTRAMVMTLTNAPSWALLSSVWHGVQTELDLPAPAIAVSGIDGLQLWFSLAEPVPVAQAHAFLDALRVRFLPEIDKRRIGLMPAADTPHPQPHPRQHAALVPALQESTGNWSAFVAADLAPVFAETPWLDIPPNEEGQATLLRGLSTIKPALFEDALKQLGLSVDAALSPSRQDPHKQPVTATADDEPKRFLLRVMNDGSAPLALRIEAAKALLQHANEPRPPQAG